MELKTEAKLAQNALEKAEKVPARDGFGKGLVELGEKNENVVVLCGDLTDSTRTNWFKEKFPDRFIEVGVAEQNMAGIAAGLALEGKIPFMATYSVFCPGRNWDQIRVSICYSKANVKFCGAHAGISVGPDGATHQGLEDIAITRCLPNLTVIAPCDHIEARKATIAAGELNGPVYLRFGREKVPTITTQDTPFEIGKAEVYKEGSDIAILACGMLVHSALVAAEELEKQGTSAKVINCHTIKPLDAETISNAAKECKAVVIAEEHQVNGGLASAVAEALGENNPVPLARVGMQDSFGESGKPEELLEKYKMSPKGIVEAARKTVKRK
ncbi:MAG: transketolase family protein [Candidatus Micrarchaeia archaeon]